jgi:hypothetical protein
MEEETRYVTKFLDKGMPMTAIIKRLTQSDGEGVIHPFMVYSWVKDVKLKRKLS